MNGNVVSIERHWDAFQAACEISIKRKLNAVEKKLYRLIYFTGALAGINATTEVAVRNQRNPFGIQMGMASLSRECLEKSAPLGQVLEEIQMPGGEIIMAQAESQYVVDVAEAAESSGAQQEAEQA